ncbi:unnamed protein product [Eruca vesicaria subsp. sativa]|uniref:Pentatricopeptide repeat-containing protein n=1 Tax=Eruca vesicaria subsp. sativa TaxID=29727 RepID=A0ABC8KJC2_ERUVS|nr:unnamed protein product [Eruca vesicaria subsp. sativa]
MATSFTSRLNLDLGNKLKRLVSEQLHDEALRLYKQKIHPLGTNGFTSILPSVIKASSFQQKEPFLLNEQLHTLCLKSGADRDIIISNSIISMYAKFSNAFSARKVFDEMSKRDTVSYCSVVNCYIQDGLLCEAVELVKEMYFDGVVLKSELVASLLALCARVGRSRKVGRMLHALSLVDERMQGSVLLSTALVDMHLKFGDFATAFYVFEQMEVKNEVSWTAMISGCVANRSYEMGVGLFLEMQRENLRPNRVTVMSVLPACVELGCGLGMVKEIHGFSFRSGFDSEDRLRAGLVTMYCRCGNVRLARLVFEEAKVRDVVMWSSMIGGYAEDGDCREAMNLFTQMREEGSEPNSVTLLAVVSACKHSASLSFASRIHSYILKRGFMSNILLGNALIDMYAKCGSLVAARKVFYQLNEKDVVSWSSMINAYGLHGQGSEALEIFQEMIKNGEKADAMAFLAVLSACNHAGLVEEAQTIFTEAEKSNRMSLTLEHYACYINLLGRSGKIDDAVQAVKNMPMKPSARIWSSLLSACEIHDKCDVAREIIASELMKSEPDNPANYVLLSKINTESGNCYGAEEVRRVMQRRGLSKCYGFSKVES